MTLFHIFCLFLFASISNATFAQESPCHRRCLENDYRGQCDFANAPPRVLCRNDTKTILICAKGFPQYLPATSFCNERAPARLDTARSFINAKAEIFERKFQLCREIDRSRSDKEFSQFEKSIYLLLESQRNKPRLEIIDRQEPTASIDRSFIKDTADDEIILIKWPIKYPLKKTLQQVAQMTYRLCYEIESL